MATKLPTLNSDINAWITLNNYFNADNENIDVVKNGNNPPTIKQYTRTKFYKTTSDTISSSQATGNNEYSAGSTITYLVNEAIYEDGGDITFTWGGTTRGETLPSISDGTWYLYLKGSLDTNSTTIGQGKYNVTTNAPTYDIVKGGWYHATDGHAIAKFVVSLSVVGNIITLGNNLLTSDLDPVALSFTPGRVGQSWIDTAADNIYFSSGTGALDWISASDTGLLTNYYDTGWINRSDWTNVHLGTDTTKNVDSDVDHNLTVNISKLLVKVLISTDGTDANSFEVLTNYASAASGTQGIQVNQVDTDSLIVQTGASGILTLQSDGTPLYLDTEDWYYKIVVIRLY